MAFPELTRTWFHESTYLILLSVPDEQALYDWAHRLITMRRDDGIEIPWQLWDEPDLNDEKTALAVLPGEHARLFANLPLQGKELAMT